MIRLLLNNYNDSSVRKLEKVFDNACVNLLNSSDCKRQFLGTCDACNYRQVCRDIFETRDYLAGLRK